MSLSLGRLDFKEVFPSHINFPSNDLVVLKQIVPDDDSYMSLNEAVLNNTGHSLYGRCFKPASTLLLFFELIPAVLGPG